MPSEPESPLAERIVWPWATISAKIVLSTLGAVVLKASQVNHDVETIWAVSSVAILRQLSIAPSGVLGAS